MKVLFLTPQLPYPPRQGAAIRNLNLIKHLATEHEISLLSFASPDEVSPGVAGLRDYCRRVETASRPVRPAWRRGFFLLSSSRPDMADRLGSAVCAATLGAWLETEQFDLVQVEGLELAPYLDIIRRSGSRRGRRPLIVFDEHNAEYVLQRRAFESDVARLRKWLGAAYSLVQWRRLRSYERRACLLADKVVTVSEADRQALLSLTRTLDVSVVPNGVDGGYFSVENLAKADSGSSTQPLPANAIVFSGSMDFRPNVDAVRWLCDEIFPGIRAHVPDAQLFVVGRRPSEGVRMLAQRPGVTVTGEVEDVRPYFFGSAVCLVPMRIGGGVRLKVLEGMSMERATVSTPMGCDGLDVVDGKHVRLAERAPEFARAVVDLLRNPEERRRLGQRGRQLAVEKYDWRVIAPRLGAIYRELAEEMAFEPPF